MMKICGAVVLYNPTDKIINNLKTYVYFVDELIIFDNSTKYNNKIDEIKLLKKVKYISYDKNVGIARALRESLEYATLQKYDWCLTMDQDSYFTLSDEDFNNVRKYLKKYSDAGIVSFDYNNFGKSKIRKVSNWITSGNMINVKRYSEIFGFRDELFIDFVDFDICNQFCKKGIPIYIIDYSIMHEIGNPIEKKILFTKMISMNHSPIRYYYRYRNCLYLFKEDKKRYFKKLIYEYIFNLFKMLIVENNRKEKIKMIFKAVKDAKNNKLGMIE